MVTSAFPTMLSSLSSLTLLDLAGNQLLGTIPAATIASLSQLSVLSLSSNGLTGSLPSTLTAVTGLRY